MVRGGRHIIIHINNHISIHMKVYEERLINHLWLIMGINKVGSKVPAFTLKHYMN